MANRLLLLLSLLLAPSLLAQSSDLRILAQGNPFDVLMALVNNGPDTARNVVITAEFPETLTVKRALFATAQCVAAPGAIRCEIGDFTTASPTYGGFEFEPVVADANWTVTVRVTSDTPDPVADNDVATATWTSRIEADLEPRILTFTDRVDPGETARFQTFFCNNILGNRTPEQLTLDLTATNGVIETLTPSEGFSCTTNGATATCSGTRFANERCTALFEVIVRSDADREGGAVTLTAKASSEVPDFKADNDRTTSATGIYRWIAVTSTADSGPGSLRAAIADANGNCSPGPCRIVFEIPEPVPAEGWFTIMPAAPLPAITADRVTLEGQRQTALTGDTNPSGPEIAIDGRVAREGLRFLSQCEAVVDSLAIRNFDDHGLRMTGYGEYERCRVRPDRREVVHSHIEQNLRGLVLDGAFVTIDDNTIRNNQRSGVWKWSGGTLRAHDNRVEGNGASGFFIGPEVYGAELLRNTIANNREMGVAVARGAQFIDIRQNAMKDNGGLGIDWELDGVSPNDRDDTGGRSSNAPTLLSAQYDAATNRTNVTFTVKSGPLGSASNHGVITFYANQSPDGDGEQFAGESQVQFSENGTISTWFPGDVRGKWLNATWTRVHFTFLQSPKISSQAFAGGDAHTSELSNAVLVE